MLCRHRLSFVALALACSAAAACGSNSSGNPDAPVIKTTDAPPPPDAMPDALVCTAPEMMCTTGSCTNTNTDEQNCGSCGNVCQGGAFCDATQTDPCHCPNPADFLPDNLQPGTLLPDIFQQITQVHFNIGIGPFADGTGKIDGLVAVVSTASTGGTQTNKDYTLTDPTSSGLPTPPVISALYGIDIGTMRADAQYVATSGTVRFKTLQCDAQGTEIQGTLTDVTFQGIKGDLMAGTAMVDPNGCSFTVTSMDFDMKTSSACTP